MKLGLGMSEYLRPKDLSSRSAWGLVGNEGIHYDQIGVRFPYSLLTTSKPVRTQLQQCIVYPQTDRHPASHSPMDLDEGARARENKNCKL